MSKAEILDQLPKLSPRQRSQLFERLSELHEADLISGEEPTLAEREALDEALKEFEHDRNPGEPWREVFCRLRDSRQ